MYQSINVILIILIVVLISGDLLAFSSKKKIKDSNQAKVVIHWASFVLFCFVLFLFSFLGMKNNKATTYNNQSKLIVKKDMYS